MYQNFLNVKKLAVAALCLSIANFYCFGQSLTKIDSLKRDLESTKGEQRIDLLYDLAYEYIDVDNHVALDYATGGMEEATQLGDSLRMVRLGRLRASALRRLERIKDAIDLTNYILSVAKRNKYQDEVILLLNPLAVAYTLNAEYDNALNLHFEALVIREKENNKPEISVTLNNIGLVFFKMRNYFKAIEYYTQALAIKEEINSTADVDRININIGLCYNQLKNFDAARKHIDKALEICAPNCADRILIEGNFGLGVSMFGQNKFEEAIRYFNTSHEIAEKVGNKRFQAENLVYLGKIYIKQTKNQEAIEVLNKAEGMAQGSGYNELLIDVYRQLSVLYNQADDFKNAVNYQGKYIQLKDTVYSERLIENIAKIQTNYAERENLATIAAKEEQIQRQRSLNIAIVIIAVLATLLIFVLYRSNQVKKKVNAALSEAKSIIEDQNRQLLNSNFNLDQELKLKNADLEKANESLRRVNEELDNFIYKTSHDIRGPLASLKGMCNVALMDVKDPLALGYLKKLDITAEKLNTILTRLLIVNQINNSTLGHDRIDFSSIVNDVLMLEKKKGLPPRLKITKTIDEDIEFYSDKEFVRIILENLIDNAIKFYNDSERIEPFVDISVGYEGDYVKIKVVDNGIGISEVHPDKIFQMFSRASERSETGGIGLYITKTATEKLGGTVNLKTTPDGYTEFYVKLPLALARVMA